MPTSAPGSKPGSKTRGFTLVELLVVISLIALATMTIGLALPDPQRAQLEREGERLVALLESARAEARASGLEVRWQPGSTVEGEHFRFSGLPQRVTLPSRWLGDPPTVELDGQLPMLQLGPEPLLPRQGLRLRLGAQELRIASDGLAPFAIQ